MNRVQKIKILKILVITYAEKRNLWFDESCTKNKNVHLEENGDLDPNFL